ncbi:hypothetical protein LPJGGPFB_03155 [Ensifer adhaerens]|uniref:helix-turn-helix transcriptional regulator n=1 Tax=Ensifer adhaerens TaxID=106592 RepID=UPI001569AAAC|nr:AlpA family phage regulatory protein [Ensifer adhaerens]NRP19897.1 hypothetical protein [Ensifer adhaerens]
MNLLSLADLHAKGIKFSRTHIYRLIKAGDFPKPIKVGRQRSAWIEVEIEKFIQSRVDERDRGAA